MSDTLTHPQPAKPLRGGFSTGAYLTATAVAACHAYLGLPYVSKLKIQFADGVVRAINVDGARLHGDASAEAWSIKDAGEDVDATNGLRLTSQVNFAVDPSQSFEARAEDFVETLGAVRFILRGGSGVGLVSRDGLDVPRGKVAINPTPRRMLWTNLAALDLGPVREVLIELNIERGAEVARRTLNPKLGIENGLSVLGTTGLVIPCSHAAYIATIELMVRGVYRLGGDSVSLVTGGRSHRWLKTRYPDAEEAAIVRFGDFIRESLECCAQYHMSEVRVVCMVGKLAKYALGIPNTHAKKVEQSPEKVAELLQRLGYAEDLTAATDDCRSVRELLSRLAPEQQLRVIGLLRDEAVQQLSRWAGGAHLQIHVLDTTGEREILCESNG
ncbi:cobalt-precorrin-5B (C(1))-methyltransferase CbiD [Coraliomargarita algicola]|uniref:Cobalt-precorrin-5B C(1)-methyltransferase n=1 Tax=Coraliomargarita algicola TaxID=3092156 RepID=A0ABZ0RI62_9BACT|nr:cobalt-precorrin-5B (C(1))-methyltransferase CbiD [Coraliomargarita sp. J2-16]WPJ94627.1 cobalt-precorrin-5B (C(1))-methyltransferase CbiD [Coraliomargarita sp. J2-16]